MSCHAWRRTGPAGGHARRCDWRQDRLAFRDSGDAMDVDQAMIVAGVGGRKRGGAGAIFGAPMAGVFRGGGGPAGVPLLTPTAAASGGARAPAGPPPPCASPGPLLPTA